MCPRLFLRGVWRPRLGLHSCNDAIFIRCLVKYPRGVSTSSHVPPPNPRLTEKWKKSKPQRTDIVSEELVDDIVQRLSHVITADKPSVILDLCPGWGVLSSKLNEVYQPDLHVLIEPRIKRYKPYLEELTAKKGVELYSEPVHYRIPYGIDWLTIINKYLVNSDLSKENMNVLVVTNFSDNSFKQVSSLWAYLQGSILLDYGTLRKWKFRFLGIMHPDDAEAIIPRSVGNRKKPALVNEITASNTMYIAETGNWEYLAPRGYEIVSKSAALAAQRTLDGNVTIPEGRERPTIEPIIDLPVGADDRGTRITNPLFPGSGLCRFRDNFVDAQKKYEKALGSKKNIDKKELSRLRSKVATSRTQLLFHTRNVDESIDLAKEQIDIDRVQSDLEKARMNADTDPKILSALDSCLNEKREALTQRVAKSVAHVDRAVTVWIDQYRASGGATGDLKNSQLQWDYRPFEPLYIHPWDVWPNGKACSIVYMEPKSLDDILESLSIRTAHQRHEEAVEIAYAVVGSFGTRSRESLAEMFDKLFPGKSITEILKMVPGLFPYIPKRLVPSSSSPDVEGGETDQPSSLSYIDAFEYFPQKMRLQCIPSRLMLDFLRIYLTSLSTNYKSFIQVYRTLGGSATQYSLRAWVLDKKIK